jgi:AICAR transformylase/IMP cyclohydrolase PurH
MLAKPLNPSFVMPSQDSTGTSSPSHKILSEREAIAQLNDSLEAAWKAVKDIYFHVRRNRITFDPSLEVTGLGARCGQIMTMLHILALESRERNRK